MMSISLNVNNDVTVRLTPLGEEILKEHYEGLAREANCKVAILDPGALVRGHDEGEGRQRFQMYDLMCIFGKYVYVGAPQVFQDNTIII